MLLSALPDAENVAVESSVYTHSPTLLQLYSHVRNYLLSFFGALKGSPYNAGKAAKFSDLAF